MEDTMTVRQFEVERLRARVAVRAAQTQIENAIARITDPDLEYWLNACVDDMQDHMETIERIQNVGL